MATWKLFEKENGTKLDWKKILIIWRNDRKKKEKDVIHLGFLCNKKNI